MFDVNLQPLPKPFNQIVEIPSCLSYNIRALDIAAQIKGTVRVENALKCDDTAAMVNILKTLGIEVIEGDTYFDVVGDISQVKEGDYTLDVNLSGRTARFALPLLCLVPGVKILTGATPFLKRPMKGQIDGLLQMGAKIEYLGKEGCLPVKITSTSLNPNKIIMDGTVSSQFPAGIMAVAPSIGGVEIEIEGNQTSKPWIDMTIDVMKHFGVNVENQNYEKYIVKSGQSYSGTSYRCETDAMSASYLWGIAALTGSTCTVPDLNAISAQGDVRFPKFLEMMGAKVSYNPDHSISVTGAGKLKAIEVDMQSHTDTAVTIMALAAVAEGTTKIYNIHHLKAKECDRLECPAAELRKMGIQVETTENAITITGGKLNAAIIDTYHDHRMAMSFAMLGAVFPGIKIHNAQVVSKSFPGFWTILESVGVGVDRD
ncbi:MAG: 3-phosphoshikimate 1-carboxyvinyltransferase [bacterium]